MKNLNGSKGPLRKYLHMWKKHPFDVVISSRRNYAHPISTITSCCTGETGQFSFAFQLCGAAVATCPTPRLNTDGPSIIPHESLGYSLPYTPSSLGSIARLCCGLLHAPGWRHSPSELWGQSGAGAPHCRGGTHCPHSSVLGLCPAAFCVGKEDTDGTFLFFFLLQHSFLSWKLVT